MALRIIDRNLLIDNTGQIKTRFNNTLESIQDVISTYLEITKKEIPFLNFGNTLVERIFRSVNEDEIIGLITELVADLRVNFGLDIQDFNAIIENDKILLKLLFSGDYVIETSINNPNL